MILQQSKKHKILHVMHSRKCGGAERHVVLMVRQLQQLGYIVRGVCPSGSWLSEHFPKDVEQHSVRMRGFYDVVSLIKLRYIVKNMTLEKLLLWGR